MTAPAPESDSAAYVAAVVMAYVELPETPLVGQPSGPPAGSPAA